MPKPDHRLTVVASIVCLALGWWLATSPESPVRPDPTPDRPVLRFLAKVAKLGLWVMLAGEEPPTTVNHIAQHGPHTINHAEGW
jgi:hypothetical protein